MKNKLELCTPSISILLTLLSRAVHTVHALMIHSKSDKYKYDYIYE